MIAYRLFLGNKAEKQFHELDSKMRQRVEELFQTLENAPVPFKEYDLVKLAGSDSTYRVRLSSHRLLYEVYEAEGTIRVTKIERRSDNTYD